MPAKRKSAVRPEGKQLDFSFFTSPAPALKDKLGISQLVGYSNFSDEEISDFIAKSTTGRGLHLLKECSSKSQELADLKVCIHTMLLKEANFDITEPSSWQKKISALKNLLEKFEVVNNDQICLVNSLQKSYPSQYIQVDAEHREEASQLLQNFSKFCETLQKQMDAIEWDENSYLESGDFKTASAKLSQTVLTFRTSQFLHQ